MKLRIIIAFILITIFSVNVLISQDNKFHFSFQYENEGNNNFFKFNTKTKSEYVDMYYLPLIDTLENNILDTIGWQSRNYLINYQRHTLKFGFKYIPTKYIDLKVDIPLSFYSYEEVWGKRFQRWGDDLPAESKYIYHYYGPEQIRRDFSLTRVDYLGLSADWYLIKNKYWLALLGNIRLPISSDDLLGFKGISSDSNSFLSSGWFEYRTGLKTAINFSTFRMESSVLYNYRADEMSNQILANALLSFNRVKDTEFNVHFNYAKSIGDYKEEFAYSMWQENIWSEYLDMDINLKMLVYKKYLFAAGYNVRIWGSNCMNRSFYHLSFAYQL